MKNILIEIHLCNKKINNYLCKTFESVFYKNTIQWRNGSVAQLDRATDF